MCSGMHNAGTHVFGFCAGGAIFCQVSGCQFVIQIQLFLIHPWIKPKSSPFFHLSVPYTLLITSGVLSHWIRYVPSNRSSNIPVHFVVPHSTLILDGIVQLLIYWTHLIQVISRGGAGTLGPGLGTPNIKHD